jgi:hypothetical protein
MMMFNLSSPRFFVMAGLDPAIHDFSGDAFLSEVVDARDRRGHDGERAVFLPIFATSRGLPA